MDSFLKRVSQCEAARQLLSGWGLTVAQETVPLDARQLAPEQIIFGGDFKETVNPRADWGRTATGRPCLTPVNLTKWAVFFVERNKPQVQNFCKVLQQQAPRMGIQIANPKVREREDDFFLAG